MKQTKEVIYGLYNDETELLHAVEEAQHQGLDIMDVYTPFPVHGLDKAMGLKESRLHQTGFVYGLTGTLTAFSFMTWVFTKDWPLVFGGKPYFSLPAFGPIMFELTVLFAAVGMTLTFYIICGLGPGVKNLILDERISDDKFCLAFETDGLTREGVDKLGGFFRKTGAAEVNVKTV
jgi:hypothetical protein